jgi:hypothetical protein
MSCIALRVGVDNELPVPITRATDRTDQWTATQRAHGAREWGSPKTEAAEGFGSVARAGFKAANLSGGRARLRRKPPRKDAPARTSKRPRVEFTDRETRESSRDCFKLRLDLALDAPAGIEHQREQRIIARAKGDLRSMLVWSARYCASQ